MDYLKNDENIKCPKCGYKRFRVYFLNGKSWCCDYECLNCNIVFEYSKVRKKKYHKIWKNNKERLEEKEKERENEKIK